MEKRFMIIQKIQEKKKSSDKNCTKHSRNEKYNCEEKRLEAWQ